VSDDRQRTEILDVLGDESARDILAILNTEPHSAKELDDACDVSLPTIYRRIETLESHDLVQTRRAIGEDGNRYKVYASNFDSTIVSLVEDEYDVEVFHRQKLPDRFSQLWDELQVGTTAES